jgi:DNA (cytosine-5)-methyltransferase 1
MKSFVFGSVCSGIEAASVAFGPLGMHPAWLSEIEPFPSAVLAHHYPEVSNLGDMTAIADRILVGEVYPPDMLCGGTPCQAFSVAGLRKSLDDARGNLSLVFCELANAIDQRRADLGLDPSIVFWENVPGVLNTSDNAFGCFLAGLAGEDNPLAPPRGKWTNAGYVSGPKRTVAWRVLDAQYFGVAQRRRRVFVIASARDHFDPAAILFEFDGMRRDSAPSRQAREGVAGGIEIGPGGGRLTDLNPTLDTRAKDGPIRNQLAGAVMQPVAAYPVGVAIEDPVPPLMARSSRGGAQTLSPGHQTDGHMVAVAQPIGWSEELTASVDLAGTIQRGGSGGRHDGVMQTNMAVRRLTPVECERLQGFPDGYTQIPWRKKPASDCPDGPRYKTLGNSWAVPCVSWIGQRIRREVLKGLA